MSSPKSLPLAFISKFLEVDSTLPTLCLRWRRSPARAIPAGSPAGYVTDDGNGNPIGRIRIQNQAYLNHRIVFYLVNGFDPGPDMTVDHGLFQYTTNTDLRLASRTQQAQNRRKKKGTYTSKYKGVRFRKDCGKWAAQISVNGVNKSLGVYGTELEAASAYNKAALAAFGEFSCLNELPQ
jgi:hypothetical protein